MGTNVLRIKWKIIVALFITSLSYAHAMAGNPDEHGKGNISMRGEVVETACGIATESIDQTIDMGISAVSDILRDGKGNLRNFKIKLVNCVVPESLKMKRNESHHFSITFDGKSTGSLFELSGETSGVSLTIINSNGEQAMPGRAMQLKPIEHEYETQNYSIRLVSNSKKIKPGRYFSTIRYKLDYY